MLRQDCTHIPKINEIGGRKSGKSDEAEKESLRRSFGIFNSKEQLLRHYGVIEAQHARWDDIIDPMIFYRIERFVGKVKAGKEMFYAVIFLQKAKDPLRNMELRTRHDYPYMLECARRSIWASQDDIWRIYCKTR